jgi:hypothetical protein
MAEEESKRLSGAVVCSRCQYGVSALSKDAAEAVPT